MNRGANGPDASGRGNRFRSAAGRALGRSVFGLGLIASSWAAPVPAETSAPSDPGAPSTHRERLLHAFKDRGEAAIPELDQALESEATLVRRTAAHLLARLGEEAAEAQKRAAAHPDAQVRRIAWAALPREQVLEEYLGDLLSDPDPVLRGWVWGYLSRGAPRESKALRAAVEILAAHAAEGTEEEQAQALRVLDHWRVRATEPVYDGFADGHENGLEEWRVSFGTGPGRPGAALLDYMREPLWDGTRVTSGAEGGLRIEHGTGERLQLRALPVSLRSRPPGPYIVEIEFRQELPVPSGTARGLSLRLSADRSGSGVSHSISAPAYPLRQTRTLREVFMLRPHGDDPIRIWFSIDLHGPAVYTIERLRLIPIH